MRVCTNLNTTLNMYITMLICVSWNNLRCDNWLLLVVWLTSCKCIDITKSLSTAHKTVCPFLCGVFLCVQYFACLTFMATTYRADWPGSTIIAIIQHESKGLFCVCDGRQLNRLNVNLNLIRLYQYYMHWMIIDYYSPFCQIFCIITNIYLLKSCNINNTFNFLVE